MSDVQRAMMDTGSGNTRLSFDIAWIDGGPSHIGTDLPVFRVDGEGPKRALTLRPFGISRTAVTNAQFADFVARTGYVSQAHRIGWSFVFRGLLDQINGPSPADLPWWHAVEGATWESPLGSGSSWSDWPNHPVVHVSHHDAVAFATYVSGRLPYEAEWEHAARGGGHPARYPWGNAEPDDNTVFCNIWQGHFPDTNTVTDGYYGTCPVDAFDPNPLGLFNMSGNVWEWCADAFRVKSVFSAAKSRNRQARRDGERVLKGGSFLCHASYCWRYRIAARTGRQPDNAASHVGFRVAFDQPHLADGRGV